MEEAKVAQLEARLAEIKCTEGTESDSTPPVVTNSMINEEEARLVGWYCLSIYEGFNVTFQKFLQSRKQSGLTYQCGKSILTLVTRGIIYKFTRQA